MTDVATRAGVSQALVSLVFRERPGAGAATRERVFAAARELGYRPDAAAQLLRSHRSHQLGVLFTMRHPHDVDIVEALHPVAEAHGYHLVLGALVPDRDERAALDSLLSLRAEAVLAIGPESVLADLAATAGDAPVIGINPHGRAGEVDTVRTDDARGVRLAVGHLVGLGHTEVHHIDGGTAPGAGERRRGFRTAMRRHGLEAQVHRGDYTEESGARVARELLDAGTLPRAVVAANDRCAHGFLDTVLRAGFRVPGDVSVVGYDDSRLAQLSSVDLTSVRQDPAETARTAVEAAVQRLDHRRTEPRHVVLDPQLVVRSSTGPPAGARP